MVPSCFCWNDEDEDDDKGSSWRPRIEAAAHGLVCLSTDTEFRHGSRRREKHLPEEEGEYRKPWTNRYCVVNPLTRSCLVLPPLPFQADRSLPPTSTSVAFLGWSNTNSVWD